MATYKITRWDPVVFGNNVHPFPMVHIQADDKFTKFAKDNNQTLIVRVSGTKTQYDGKEVVGIVYGNNKVVMYAPWIHYPSFPFSSGSLYVTGLRGEYKVPQQAVNQVIEAEEQDQAQARLDEAREMLTECYSDDNGNGRCNMNKMQIGGIMIAILVLFGTLLWISIRGKEKGE